MVPFNGDILSILSGGLYVNETESNSNTIVTVSDIAPQYVKAGVIYNNGSNVGTMTKDDYSTRYVRPPQFESDSIILKTGFVRSIILKSNTMTITRIG